MTDDAGQKRDAASSFDEHAASYVTSEVHRAGDDLETLASWCDDAELALDVATGAGHTAGAIADAGADRVVAADAAPNMVRTAVSEYPAVEGVVADAERLPFQTDGVDAVSCRIAAHHFPDPRTFVREVARVLEPGGTFAFEDNIAPPDPDLDAFLNRVESLRDPSHVRSHTQSEWERWISDAGLSVERSFVVKKTIDFEYWTEQLDVSPETTRELQRLLADPPEGGERLFEIERSDGRVVSFANLKVVLRAVA